MEIQTPKYVHDCKDCVLTGQDEDYDFYYCKNADGGSVIARYGSDPSQYQSSPVQMLLGWLKGFMRDVDGKEMSTDKKESLPLIKGLRAYLSRLHH